LSDDIEFVDLNNVSDTDTEVPYVSARENSSMSYLVNTYFSNGASANKFVNYSLLKDLTPSQPFPNSFASFDGAVLTLKANGITDITDVTSGRDYGSDGILSLKDKVRFEMKTQPTGLNGATIQAKTLNTNTDILQPYN
jgi:hypothetical protein